MKQLALLALMCGMGIVVAQEPPAKDAPQNTPKVEKGKGPFGKGGPRGKDKPSSFKTMLEKSDKNKDGAISKDEVDEKTWSRLGKEDADKDGKVTEKEHSEFRKSMMEKAFGKRRGEAPKDAPKKN